MNQKPGSVGSHPTPWVSSSTAGQGPFSLSTKGKPGHWKEEKGVWGQLFQAFLAAEEQLLTVEAFDKETNRSEISVLSRSENISNAQGAKHTGSRS